jgi:hypothetical protein
MTINIIQAITNILNEDRTIKASSTVETYLLTPTEGKVLKNIKTGEIIKTKVYLNKKVKIGDYIEIEVDEPNTF